MDKTLKMNRRRFQAGQRRVLVAQWHIGQFNTDSLNDINIGIGSVDHFVELTTTSAVKIPAGKVCGVCGIYSPLASHHRPVQI